MSIDDRRLLDQFAERVRAHAPSAVIYAFGSRARGTADPESDLDLCVIVPEVTREISDAVGTVAWEIGFEAGRVLAPIMVSADAFERGPLSASTLVANIRREGVSA